MINCLNLIILLLTCVQATDRPIIGVLAEEVFDENGKPSVEFTSSIVASYVKGVEQAGARVVPIFLNRTHDYYRDLLSRLNGVFFPGGGVYFNHTGGYADAGRIILNYSKEVNSKGDHFPILAVCLGFELLFYLEVESYEILDYCNSLDVALPLIFKENFKSSKLYKRAPKKILRILSKLPVTYNHHKRCVTEELLRKYNLSESWHVLSTNFDEGGKEFISSVESRQFPIAGIQFHPEKAMFEWDIALNIPHSKKAIHSGRYFFDWLVNEARRSNHSFNDSEEEKKALIYNYNASYTAGYYEQIYYFK